MSDQPCPKCGHCDKCGRSNTPAQVYPFYPWPYGTQPYRVYPQPWNHYYQPYYYSNVTAGNNISTSSQYNLSHTI